ncbi:Phosphatidylinositol transfer protein sfh5 [Ceratocystis fimbriata CBS 114723]|uniref:Phosphatidylinositol transfer protein SFH5 n=1 Tax=Ceratocystis fimbriata CBS 114723 TaxID=1035309 RepID=A0A2C5X146_9PEZI|nr:Phosphatidylinositol transfer protein sfh5 [Ceratocystis fimbriata CBS 114723]
MAAISTESKPVAAAAATSATAEEEVSFVTASDAGGASVTKETEAQPTAATTATTTADDKAELADIEAKAETKIETEAVADKADATAASAAAGPKTDDNDDDKKPKTEEEAPVISGTAEAAEAATTEKTDATPDTTATDVSKVAVAATAETPATTAAETSAAVATKQTAEATTSTPASTSEAEPPTSTTEPPVADEKPATPLELLAKALPSIIAQAQYAEMWGIDLKKESIPATIVLQKYLRANDDNVEKAEAQLIEALKWRREVNPIHQLESKIFEEKFKDLGYVTVHEAPGGKEQVIAWNIYGAVKDKKATFGNVDEFITWRSAFMELSVRQLKIDQATEIIPAGGEDPYQMIQVHDYKGVSFLRMDADTKAATAETIKVLSTAYPELLFHKYFVNVPSIMGFVFSIVKRIVSPATVRKFHPMSSGTSLAAEVKGINLPEEYGGSGPSVTTGFTVKLAEAPEVDAEPKAPAAASPAPAETEPVVAVAASEPETTAGEAATAAATTNVATTPPKTPDVAATTTDAATTEATAAITVPKQEDKQVTEKSS